MQRLLKKNAIYRITEENLLRTDRAKMLALWYSSLSELSVLSKYIYMPM